MSFGEENRRGNGRKLRRPVRERYNGIGDYKKMVYLIELQLFPTVMPNRMHLFHNNTFQMMYCRKHLTISTQTLCSICKPKCIRINFLIFIQKYCYVYSCISAPCTPIAEAIQQGKISYCEQSENKGCMVSQAPRL